MKLTKRPICVLELWKMIFYLRFFFCLPFVENGRLKILLELPGFSGSFQLFLSVPEFRRADR